MQPTTLEILTHAIPLLEKYDKALIGSVERDVIMAGQSDIFFQLGITNPELMASGQKMFTNLFANMKSDMRELVGGFLKTGLNNIHAVGAYNTTLSKAKGIFNKYYKDMFMTGTNAMGNPYYRDLGMTRKDAAFLNKAIRTEMRYMRRFLRDIMNPAHVPRHSYLKRGGYYGESSRAQFLNGMVAGAGKNLDIRWELNMYGSPLTDHCDYCPTYARRLWTWETLPTVPRGGDTPCLFKCYCGLSFHPKKGSPRVQVPGRPIADGMLRAGRFARVADAQGQMVGGTFQANIEAIYARMYKARQMIEVTTGATQRGWITLRRSLNSEVITMMKNRGYRVTPTVSVTSLIETIKSAQAKGGTLKALAELGLGDEIVFVRGNYSGVGVVALNARNQVVYRGADGRDFIIDDVSDLTFVLEKQWKPSGTLEQAEAWSKNSAVGNEIFYHGTSAKNTQGIKTSGFSSEFIGENSGNEGFWGKGFYFAREKSYVGIYARGEIEGVLKVRINVKNPMSGEKWYTYIDKARKQLEAQGIKPNTTKLIRGATELAKQAGYDAVDAGTEFCVFDFKDIMVID